VRTSSSSAATRERNIGATRNIAMVMIRGRLFRRLPEATWNETTTDIPLIHRGLWDGHAGSSEWTVRPDLQAAGSWTAAAIPLSGDVAIRGDRIAAVGFLAAAAS